MSAVVLFAGDLAACEQVVAEVGGGIATFFGNSVTLKHFAKRSEDDFYVAKEGDFLDVFEIVADFSLPSDCIASAYLRESAEPLPHGVALALLLGHKDHVTHELRSGPDYGHVALKDVEQFREFVEAGGAQELAVGIQANIVREQVALRVLLVGHRAEFYESEDLFIFAWARLRKEGVALHLDCAEDGEHDKNRAQAQDRG